MTDLYNILLTDILPDVFSDTKKTKAYALAEKDVRQMIYDYAINTMLYEHLDKQKDSVLDLMAAEMKTQYYSSDMDHDTKVKMIQNTIRWHILAGTPSAVQEMVKTVFGSGEVIEWFDYNGSPFCFKIKTDEDLNHDIMIRFREMIKKVKNTCSTLEEIMISHDLIQDISVSGRVCSESAVNISYEEEDER